MKSMTLQVTKKGLTLHLSLRGTSPTDIVLVLPDEVDISETRFDENAPDSVVEQNQPLPSHIPVSPVVTSNGFPPRKLTEETIIQILREHGGSVKISDVSTGWNIYDEIAARLAVSIEARIRCRLG